MGNCTNALTTNKQCMHSGECLNNKPTIQTRPINIVHSKNDKGEDVDILSFVNDEDNELEFTTNTEEPMPAPPVVLAETKKEKKDKVKAEDELLIAPSIVGNEK